jgi:hypothetical protein
VTSVKDYLAKIGSKGGKAKGASKRRPNAHYERLAAMKRKKAKAKKRDSPSGRQNEGEKHG